MKKNVEARIPGDDRRRAKTRTWKRATWCCPFWEAQRSSRSRHKRAMTATIEIESMCCCWRPAAVAGCGSSDPMVTQGEQPLGPPWRTHREGRGGCQGSLRVGDGVKESKGGRVLEAWKNFDVVRSALSVVRLRTPPGMAIRGGRARDRGWRDHSETVEAAVVGRTVQGLQCCAVEKKEPGQDRNELRRVTPSPWPHVPVPHFISVMGIVSGSPVLMAGEDGFEMPTWNISITDWPKVWFGLSCDERVHVSNSNPDLVPSCVPPTRPSFSSLGKKDDGSPSDPVDRGEKHWPFLFRNRILCLCLSANRDIDQVEPTRGLFALGRLQDR